MAIHLNLNSILKKENKENAKLHSMPCIIKSNGEAKVSTYFEPIVTTRKDKVLQASFRGYPLLGREINVPKGYTGIVLQEMHQNLSEEDERRLYGTHVFDKFVSWNWDSEPSGNDKIEGALEWLEIAKALHGPVDI